MYMTGEQENKVDEQAMQNILIFAFMLLQGKVGTRANAHTLRAFP